MILSGSKEIAGYLGCGIRTAQRWEEKGLPVKRPNPGRRSHVVADSAQLDPRVRDGDIQRARELRAEVQRTRKILHLKMEQLRKELAALGAKRRQRKG